MQSLYQDTHGTEAAEKPTYFFISSSCVFLPLRKYQAFLAKLRNEAGSSRPPLLTSGRPMRGGRCGNCRIERMWVQICDETAFARGEVVCNSLQETYLPTAMRSRDPPTADENGSFHSQKRNRLPISIIPVVLFLIPFLGVSEAKVTPLKSTACRTLGLLDITM